MAYGVRWFSEFDDIHENVVYRVEIRERDYSGEATEVMSEGSEPLVIDMAKVDNVFTPLRPQKATVRWMAQEGVDFQISDLYIDDDRKYQLHVYEEHGESLIPRWFGWVVPIELEEPFASKPYAVTFSATCGLPFLSDDYVLDASGSFVLGEKTLIQVIANCLTSTGMELDIDTYISLSAEGMSAGSSLTQAEFDSDGLRGKYADETLAGILAPFRAHITQANGKWVIKGAVEQNGLISTWIGFDAAGNQVGTATVSQAAGIGRTRYSLYSHLRPTADVIEKIAEPNSIITETVSPGIPVNRLPNGLFAGPVLGGNIPGWNNHIGSIPWARMGSNKPDDPYRLEMYQHIEFDPKKKKRAFKPFVYFDSGPITLNVGDFNIPLDKRKETKIVLAGAFKSNNSLSATFMLSVNEDERDKNDYLDDNGEWFYSKKEDRTYSKRSNQSKYEPGPKGYNDLKLQTFEIESKKVQNFLDRPEGALVVLRLRIFPAIQGPGYNGGNIFFSLEDLSLIVVEDTVYEGDHKYQINAHLPIRNANEVEYTSIIADKIDIDTPEQSREVNRVMTGYMTLAGTSTLTTGWKYPGMVSYDPIQKLSLRTSLRQLSGKRRTLDGNFLGYEVTPDMSIFNRYDQPGTPSTFYSQTSWRWNVKDGSYDISATELNVFPLATEDLYLYDDEEGRRGNRMYRGNSTSGSGNGQSQQQGDEILLDDIEPFEYEILVEDEDYRILDIGPLIVSSHTPNTLEAQLLWWPEWISEIFIYRGEDLDPEDVPENGILQVQWIGKPTISGLQHIIMELIGPDGEDLMLRIPLEVEPSEDFIESWPPKFLPFPNLIFVKGKEQTKHLQLDDYLDPDGEHTGAGLSYRILDRPVWVSSQTVVFNDLAVTGKPTQVGIEKMLIEVSDAIDRTTLIQVNLQVIEPTKIEYFLRDTSSGAPVIVGEIVQGAGFEKPESSFDILINVTGRHQGWYSRLVGVGLDIKPTADPYDLVSSTDAASYTIGSYLPSEVGFYDITAATYRNDGEPDNLVLDTREVIRFTLYDAEYLAKAQFELWDAVANVALGPINPDGSSMFDVKGVVEVKMVIDGVLHDLATAIMTSGGSEVHTNVYTQDPAVEDVTYGLFGAGGQVLAPALYDILLTLEHESAEQYARSISFSINKRNPQPVAVGLKLGSRPANTTNFTLITELASTGNSITPMPANWTVLNDATSDPFNKETKRLFEYKNGGLVQQDIALYTRLPTFREYDEPVTTSDYYLFDNLDSTEIGKVHHFPSTFRVVYERFMDDEMVTQYQADFSFGPVVDIDDAPVEEPGGGLVDYVADDITLEQEDADGVRTFSVKDKGVAFVKFQDLPTLSLVGKLTAGTGTPYAVPVLNGASAVAASDTTVGTTLWVKNQLTGTVSGLAGRLAKFATNNTLTYSILEESGIALIAQQGVFVSNNASNTNVRGFVVQEEGKNRFSFGKQGTPANFQFWRWDDLGTTLLGTPLSIERATGKVTLETQLTILGSVLAPLVVGSTVLVTNFNADLLDGQHGPYYLDRTNHTGTQLASTISNFSTAVLATTLTGLSTSNSAITSSDTILQAFGKIQGQITGNISGTTGRIAKFTGPNAIGASILEESGISLIARQGIFVSDNTSNTNVRGFVVQEGGSNRFSFGKQGTPADFAFWRYADDGVAILGTPISIERSTGKVTLETQLTIQGSSLAPLVVSSSVLVTNFNADLLDGQHGPYYLDWNNFTNVKSVLAGNGMTGGGPLTGNVTITLGTPATLTNITTNDVNGSTHSHAIATSSLSNGTGITLSASGANVILGNNNISIGLASSGVSAGTYNSVTVDVYGRVTSASNVSSGISGTAGYIAQFGSGGTTVVNSVIRDTGSEINVADTRSFGVEGPAAMRDYLHVWGYANFGTADNHGTILLHQANSGTIDGSAAFEVRSTSKGILFPRMTSAQRQAISSPAVGLVVWQTDSSGPNSSQGLYCHLGSGVWAYSAADYIGA